MKEVDLIKYHPIISRTKEEVNLIRTQCQCGHVLTFLSKHPKTCRHCGRLIYADKKTEFMEKMMRRIKINEQSYI